MKNRFLYSKRILAIFLSAVLTCTGNVSAFAAQNAEEIVETEAEEISEEAIIDSNEETDEEAVEKIAEPEINIEELAEEDVDFEKSVTVSDNVVMQDAEPIEDEYCGGALVDDIEIESIAEELGDINSVKARRKLSDAEELFGAQTEFPSVYSSYANGYVNEALDQRYGISSNGIKDASDYYSGVNTCWAFSTAKVIETNLIKKGQINRASKLVSPGALGYFRYNSSAGEDKNLVGCTNGLFAGHNYINTGGNTVHASLMLANRAGLVGIDKAPYSSTTPRTYDESLEYTNDVGYITSSYWMRAADSDRDYIKELITEYGAVTANIVLKPSAIKAGGGYAALYYLDTLPAATVGRHTVTIIGWDDNIPKTAFYAENGNAPEGDGGWLVMDSYGRTSNNEDNGMFYISYYDKELNKTATNSNKAITYDVSKESYDNIYQYDGTYLGSYYKQEQSEVTAANIFTANSNSEGNEKIKAVSFATYTVNADYDVEVYTNLSDETDPTSGDLICEQTGNFVFAGIHSIEFENPIIVAEGKKYSVVVTLKKRGENCTLLLSTDYNASPLNSTQTLVKGQSFYFDGFEWSDVSEGTKVNGTDTTRRGVFRIKAYTNNTTDRVNSTDNLSEDNVAAIPSQIYTGSEIKPDPVIYYNNRKLVRNVDYCLSYANNINVGTATMLVRGMGEFSNSDSVTVEFRIVQRNVSTVSINGLTDATGKNNIFLYTGKQIKPVTISYSDGKNIVDLTDEAVISYKNNVAAGTAKVEIKGIGNLTGTVTKTFTIYKRDLKDPAIEYTDVVNDYLSNAYAYDYGEIKPQLEILNKGGDSSVLLTKDKDYTAKYEYNIYPGVAQIHLSATSKGNYTGEKTLYFNIVKKDISKLDIEIETMQYTGEALIPSVVIKDGSKTLRETIDYFVKYENNVDSGVGKVTITAVDYSAYQGSIEKSFTIEKVDLSDAVMENISNYNCALNGEKYEQPSMQVRLGDKYLVENRDYKISYTNNAGKTTVDTTATVKITGINHYTGEKSQKYTIYRSISSKYVRLDDFTNTNLRVTLLTDGQSAHEMIYTGKHRKPKVKIEYKGTELVENEDYTLEYSADVIHKGTAYVDIVALDKTDKYVGSRRMYYYIIGRPINGEGTVDGGFSIVPPKDVVYNGKMNESPISIRYLGKKLKEGKDYTLTYYNNGAVTSSARVVIEGIGDYSKKLTYTYAILPLDLNKIGKSRISSKTYTGFEICPDQRLTIKKTNVIVMPDVEYKRTFVNNTNAGDAYIIYEPLTDNFTGSLKVKFKILPKKVSTFVNNIDINGIESGYIATGDKIMPIPTVSYNGLEVTTNAVDRPADIYVTYGRNVNPGKGSVCIKTLSKKRGGSGNYSGSKTIKFDIIGKAFNADWGSADSSVEYTGRTLKPSVEGIHVVDADTGEELTKNKNYSVKYVKHVEGNTYGEIILRGKGLYKNQTATLRYDIIPMLVTDDILRIGEIEDQRFRGLPVKPELVVKIKRKRLKLGRDYVVSYKNNKKAGEAKAVVCFIGNYEGQETVNFNIVN